MNQPGPRSLQHEYQLFFDREVEAYKMAVSSDRLCRIAEVAQHVIENAEQFGIRDVLLAAEVDRQIAARLELPTFERWRRLRVQNAGQPTRPGCWGLRGGTALTRAVQTSFFEAEVLVHGARVESTSLYLAANGCRVAAVEAEADVLERVLDAASTAGLADRVQGFAVEFCDFRPIASLAGVVCTPASFAWLAEFERGETFDRLQAATEAGGVHVIESLADEHDAISEAELRSRYVGWTPRFVPESTTMRTFVARKPGATGGTRRRRASI